MKKLLILSLLLAYVNIISAQDEPDKRPVPEPFSSTKLIDNQTSIMPVKKGLQFVLQHRFGTFEEGISDLYGIYAPSNINMGFNYGITDKIMLGISTEKNNKAQQLLWKYNILQQTRSNSMPVTLTYFGNVVLNGSDEESFGKQYKFIHRFSYFSQLIISKKFSDRVSVLAAPGFLHLNTADSIYQNQRFTYTIGGKINVYNSINLLVEYDDSFSINELDENQKDNDPKGNLGFAVELTTGTHTFQITLAQFRELIDQYNHSFNTNTMQDGWCLGFNITVRFY